MFQSKSWRTWANLLPCLQSHLHSPLLKTREEEEGSVNNLHFLWFAAHPSAWMSHTSSFVSVNRLYRLGLSRVCSLLILTILCAHAAGYFNNMATPKFSRSDFDKSVKAAVINLDGISCLTDPQSRSLFCFLSGNDTFVSLPTGHGKVPYLPDFHACCQGTLILWRKFYWSFRWLKNGSRYGKRLSRSRWHLHVLFRRCDNSRGGNFQSFQGWHNYEARTGLVTWAVCACSIKKVEVVGRAFFLFRGEWRWLSKQGTNLFNCFQNHNHIAFLAIVSYPRF